MAVLHVLTLVLAGFVLVITGEVIDGCLSMCLCYNNAADCTEKGLRTVSGIQFPDHLRTLILHGNNLKEMPDLSYLPHLGKLILSNNNIQTINSTRLNTMPSLRKLDLSHNSVHSLPRSTFLQRNKLQHLDLSYNNLTEIPGLSASFSHLEHLNLQHNRIRNLEAIRSNVMPKLSVLRAGHNDIQELVSTLDKHNEFPELRIVEFNNNRIERIHMFLTRFKCIRKLVLSHNRLTTINASSFINNEQLEELWLDHNNLRRMTNLWLTFKPKLTYLDLSYNQLHNIDAGSFKSAQHVKYLDISHNFLASLESKTFFNLRNLSYLNLHNNEISVVSEDIFLNVDKLLSLNFSVNMINLGDKEFDSVFKPLKLLKILDLNRNKIMMIPSNAFEGLTNLNTLYMRGNSIRVIETQAFQNLKTLSKIELLTNDLECDCSLDYLKRFVASFRSSVPQHSQRSLSSGSVLGLVCSTPLWVKGRNVTDVDVSEVACVSSAQRMVRPVVIENPHSNIVHRYHNITLRCQATSSVDSDMTLNWYQRLNDIVITHVASWTSPQQALSSRLYRRSSVLQLINVGFQDAGQYWCHVSNIFGSDWSTGANVTVVVRPSLSPDLRSEVIARSGESILIPCSAEGFPQPVIKFTKGIHATFHAVEEKRIVYKHSMFGIEKLKIEDSGTYSCIAKSSIGEANATIRLLVIEEPRLVRPMRSKSFANGTTAVVDCIISGNPRPRITWYKDGTILHSTTSKIRLSDELLVIMAFNYRDEGSYSCEATNSFLVNSSIDSLFRLGTVRSTAHLKVLNHHIAANKSKMASEVFISIIVVVVVVVIILTSLAWVTLICFCRRRRREERDKQLGTTSLASLPSETLLSELPSNYMLKCNGKLVTVGKTDEIRDEDSDSGTLLQERFYAHAPTSADLLYPIQMKESSCDGSGFQRDSYLDLPHFKRENSRGLPNYQRENSRDLLNYLSRKNSQDLASYQPSNSTRKNSREAPNYQRENSWDLAKHAMEAKFFQDDCCHAMPKYATSTPSTSSTPSNPTVSSICNSKANCTGGDTPLPSNNHPPITTCNDNWRKNLPPKPYYHCSPNHASPTDTTLCCDGKFLTSSLHPSDSSGMHGRNHNPDYDVVTHLKGSGNSAVTHHHRNNSHISQNSHIYNEDYHSYVTSSSGIESGASSENISLNNETEIIETNAIVAV